MSWEGRGGGRHVLGGEGRGEACLGRGGEGEEACLGRGGEGEEACLGRGGEGRGRRHVLGGEGVSQGEEAVRHLNTPHSEKCTSHHILHPKGDVAVAI